MDSSKFSKSAIAIVKAAYQMAIDGQHAEVTDLHLLSAVFSWEEGELYSLLLQLEMDFSGFVHHLKTVISRYPTAKGVRNLYVSRNYQKVMQLSEQMCRATFEPLISPKHLLLALLKEENTDSYQIAHSYGLTYQALSKELAKRENDKLLVDVSPEDLKKLEKFGRNLSHEALEGKLDPVIGRTEEIDRAIRILSRRIKNNPLFIGEAGVGKTAIVEGIVQKIVNDQVPPTLKNKMVFSLDMVSILAGTKYRGDFEERLKNLLDIIKKSDGKIILFIDEIHNVIGSGSMDMSNILKPMLARGEILTMGATTIAEYKLHFEKDSALDRRFHTILVEEPTEEESIEILRGIKHKYEEHHKVHIGDDAIRSAVRLSKRYLSYRRLPDIAIDMMDEASAWARIHRQEELSHAVDDQASVQLIEVHENEVKEVVAKISGMPKNSLNLWQMDSSSILKRKIQERFIGQEESIEEIVQIYLSRQSGLFKNKNNKPSGSYLFVGPKGTGKTHLAMILADEIVDGEHSFLQLDMSEFSDQSSITKIMGAPPGYVGYQSNDSLLEKVRTRSHSLILLENIPLAHPDILSLIHQMIGQGSLHDNKGRNIDFSNTIVIATVTLDGPLTKKEPLKEWYQLPESLRLLSSSFDDILYFDPLSQETMLKLVQLKLKEMKEDLAQNSIDLDWNEAVISYVAPKGKGREGASLLNKIIEKEIASKISILYLEGDLVQGDRLYLDLHVDADRGLSSINFTIQRS